jgi:hypothetical protein
MLSPIVATLSPVADSCHPSIHDPAIMLHVAPLYALCNPLPIADVYRIRHYNASEKRSKLSIELLLCSIRKLIMMIKTCQMAQFSS